jgi:hypothetical protein
MILDIYSTTLGWVDITPYIKYQGVEGTRNDVDGPNAGRVIDNALMYRDRLATKRKFQITTIPLNMSTAVMIENLLMPEFFTIRTDYFTGSPKQYTVYSNNVSKTYVINKEYGELVKLSFPIVER